MARFVVIDPEATALSFVARMLDEGSEVLHYVHQHQSREIGRNLVLQTDSLHQALAWAKRAPTVAVFASSGMGKAANDVAIGADEFRKMGVPTLCGGSFCDRLEKDRVFGEEIAKAAGCRIPPTKTFATIGQAIAFARTVGDEAWYFKSDKYLESDATFGGHDGQELADYLAVVQKKFGDAIPNLLQRKIPGVALSTACWWNGRQFCGPFESTIEHKKFMDGDLGSSTGCSFNAVWFYEAENPKIAKSLKWANLTKLFLEHKAPPGLYDINTIVAEKAGPWGPAGEAYFLEWTPRFGWDSEATSLRLLETTMSEFFEKMAHGAIDKVPVSTKELAYAVRLSVQPYPYEHLKDDKNTAKGVRIGGADGLWDGHFIAYCVGLSDAGELYVADRWGLVGLSLATGTSLSKLHDEVMAYAKDELRVPSLQFRTDGAKCIVKDAKALKALGYEIHEGIFR